MSIHALKPWTELVKLHADMESGSLAEAVFAIDLGAVATRDPTTPKVYRDPDAFFAATYITTDLQHAVGLARLAAWAEGFQGGQEARRGPRLASRR